jgi:hypothetical protein
LEHKVLNNKDSAFSNYIFPLFRKRSDGKTFYKILSYSEFEELKILGKRYVISYTKAVQYPEKLYIIELIEGSNELEYLDDIQYAAMLRYCELNLQYWI